VKDMKMNLQIKNRSGNDVYILKNLSFGFAKNILVTNVNLRIGYKDKIAILGKNGCGKTTLLRLLNEEIDPLKGISKKGAGLHIGYYDQYNLILDDNKTVLRTIWDLTPYEPQGYVLSYLAKFGFRGDDVEKKVSILSGGEKSRLFLAKLIHEKPNFLILDEPTNHLDIYMVSNLEKALMNYEGTIIFVSHDRYFIQKVATKRWFFNNKNIIETKKELEELFLSEYDSKPKNSSKYKKNKSRRTNPIILNKILDKIDESHVSLEKKREELIFSENKFSDKSIFNNVSKVKSLHKNIKIIKKDIKDLEIDLKNLEEEYLELADLES
ncbi:MAG: ABC-F family ATP-binding cassette domain-containing protein, partial [Candidatus Cloacimonetes bacterium]|nr:ABC-F family ATP-binding cassette domain-containing protein [Candidatus Cloacimonadota bacterium]